MATVFGNQGQCQQGRSRSTNALTTLGTGHWTRTGVASLPFNLAVGTYVIKAVYSGDATHLGSTSLPITVTTNPVGFTLTGDANDRNSQDFAECAAGLIRDLRGRIHRRIASGLPGIAGRCELPFSPAPTVMLAADGTAAQLTIDTNSPLTAGQMLCKVP